MDSDAPVIENREKAENRFPLQLKHCFEELLKFTLHSRLNNTSGFQLLNLSETFCSTLLKDDPAEPYSDDFHPAETKRVQKLIVKKGPEIVNILKRVAFELHIEDPLFLELKDDLEKIEEMCASDKYHRIESGNPILINKCGVLVQGVQWHPLFSGMLETESLGKVLPGVKNVEKGPFSAGLSYEGVQGLRGLMHIPGTISISLPPPRSTLLASFNMPYKPNVKSSALTHGARALAKHTYRFSNNFWGSLDGNDLNKHKLAVDVINHLIEHCSWLNVHFVALHGFVFEIRVGLPMDMVYGGRRMEVRCVDSSKFWSFPSFATGSNIMLFNSRRIT